MKVNSLLLSLFFAGLTTLTRAAAVEEHSADSFHLRASAHAEEDARRSLLAGCPLDPTYGCARIHDYVNSVCAFLCVPPDQLNSPDYVNFACGACPPASPPPPPAPVPPPAPLPDTPPLSTCPVDPTYGCVRIQTYHINQECNTVCVPEDRVGRPEYAYYECGGCEVTPPLSTCQTDPTSDDCVRLHYYGNSDECVSICVSPESAGDSFYANYECGGCSSSTFWRQLRSSRVLRPSCSLDTCSRVSP